MRQFPMAWLLVLALAAVGSMAGCGEDSGLPENHPPNIVNLFVVPENPAPNATAQVRFQVVDVDGDPVTVKWDATGGEVRFDENGKAIWYTPPEEGTYTITCIASDGQDTDRKALRVLVWKPREGNYYPLAVGNEWVFRDTKGNTIRMSIIDTIPIEHTEITSFVLRTETTDPGVPEGVVNYAYVGRAYDTERQEYEIQQHGVNAVFGSGDTVLFDPWLPLYRFPLIPDREWALKFRVFLTDGFPVGEGTATYRVIDESTLTTPAGTFENVFQVEETFTWTIFGQHIDTTVSKKWLAPNVGIVQIDQTQARGEQEAEHIVAKLVSYNLNPDESFDLIPNLPPEAVPVAAAP